MRLIFSISLLFGIALESVYSLVVVADYYANRDYIAANLCERRFEPRSCCKGMCHLSKKLNDDGHQNSKMPDLRELKLNPFFSNEISGSLFRSDRPELLVSPVFNETHWSLGFPADIFRPPQA